MEAFSQLLDALYFTASTKTKSALIQAYLRSIPDPDRGWALAAIAGTLTFDFFKRNTIKQLILEHADPVLFDLSYDYVGEMSETVAHLWPTHIEGKTLPTLGDIVETFKNAKKADVTHLLSNYLDIMNASQRWALIKLGTRGLRIGVSARALKQCLADYGNVTVEDIEAVWHGVEPPYSELLAWLEGNGEKPDVSDKITYHPVMLSHPLDETKLQELDVSEWLAEWKFDGIRVQLVSTEKGNALFSRTGDDISHSFKDLLDAVSFNGRLDGELLVLNEDGSIASFNKLQQRLNKKKPSKKLMEQYPAALMIYDALTLDGESLMAKPLTERKQALNHWFTRVDSPRFMLSDVLPAATLQDWQNYRAKADDDLTVEGLMLKRANGVYVSGRPSNQWYKWKRDPLLVDAVIMYAQRGHGKRSSFYSDFTFGAWEGEQLLPIGKAYSGFTDEELKKLDNWVRKNTIGRFGPVKEVKKELVFEVAFDAIHPSNRHKSGVAMRFPRINRIRWDKPADEADTLANVKTLIRQ
jgi:DNA ligase-1